MSKRGMRGMSMRVRVAVAAAVLAGGGAAGVVALTAGHNSAVTAESAGFIQQQPAAELHQRHLLGDEDLGHVAEHVAADAHAHAADQQLLDAVLAPHTLFFQRGKVVAVGRDEFVVRSANGTLEIWHTSGKTAVLNVGGTSMGMSAMTGGSVNMRMPSWWTMDTHTKGLAKGDLVFVFGERQHHTLKAQLVLFAAPTTKTFTPAVTPATTRPTTAPAVAPTGNVPTVSGTHF